jgi:hypothetical protein
MAMSIDLVREEATTAVQAALAELYKDLDPDQGAMQGFAAAVAEAAVVAVRHVLDRAETETSGERIV